MLEVRFELNINGVVEEITFHGSVDCCVFRASPCTQPVDLSEGKLTSVSEGSACDGKMSQRK